MQLWAASTSAWHGSLSPLGAASHRSRPSCGDSPLKGTPSVFIIAAHLKRIPGLFFFKSAASIQKLCDAHFFVPFRVKMSDGRRGWGWGRGRIYYCKPATKLGFEAWSGRFRLTSVTGCKILSWWMAEKQSQQPPCYSQPGYPRRSAVINSSFLPQHVQCPIISPAAERWRAWWMTWWTTRGTAKRWTETVPFTSWMTTTTRMMRRSDSGFIKPTWTLVTSVLIFFFGGNANKALTL